MIKKTIYRAVVLWILGISAAAAQESDQGTDQVPGNQAAQETTSVRVQKLSGLLSPIIFTAPAEVISANRSRLSARIEARIERMLVAVGDKVRSGQPLVSLDCADYELARRQTEAALQSARAQLKRAGQQLARSESLAHDTLLSKDLLEQRQTEEEAAEADTRRARVALEQAELAVERCRIDSPFDGVVTERIAARGELARPGTPLLEIVDLESVEVAAQVFPAEQVHLDASPRVFFRFLDEEYPLRIDRSVPVIDPVTRNLEVRLTFAGRRAPVGASGRLIWHGGNPGIPAGLMVQRNEQLGIFIARGDRAVFHPLPDAEEGRPAMVDLPLETLIVTDGRQGLRDGDTLNISE